MVRRILLAAGALMLLVGVHSCTVREWQSCRTGMTFRDFAVTGQTGLGHWEIEANATNRADPRPPRIFNLPFLHVRIYPGPCWRLYALGDWFSLAAIVILPAMFFELRARRKGRAAAGFPVEKQKNPADAGGVNTSDLP